MRSLKGKLRREDLIGETWVLDGDDGRSYQLVGEIPAGLAGKVVRVEGSSANAGFGLAMVGEIIEVRSIRGA